MMPKIKYLKNSPNAKKGQIKNIKEPFARLLVKLKRAEYFVETGKQPKNPEPVKQPDKPEPEKPTEENDITSSASDKGEDKKTRKSREKLDVIPSLHNTDEQP